MKTAVLAWALALLTPGLTGHAWDYIELPVATTAGESAWRDGLAARLDGLKEVRIEGGRVDVLTPSWAVEVDRPHKWHEGLGQALHYADATGRQGVLALIAYAQKPEHLTVRTKHLFELVERQCTRNDVHLLILFPAAGVANEEVRQYGALQTQRYWLNTSNATRHNSGCRYFEKTSQGRLGTAEEGTACGHCGG